APRPPQPERDPPTARSRRCLAHRRDRPPAQPGGCEARRDPPVRTRRSIVAAVDRRSSRQAGPGSHSEVTSLVATVNAVTLALPTVAQAPRELTLSRL